MRNPSRLLRILAAAASVALSTVGMSVAGASTLSPATTVSVPLTYACAGGWYSYPDATTTTTVFVAQMSCNGRGVTFAGSTTSAFPACPGDGPATVTFTGTQTDDSDPTNHVPATWTLQGASGLYGVTGSTVAGEQWSGALDNLAALTAGCGDRASGYVAVASAAESAPAPDVLACQADGTVGPNAQSGGRSGYTFTGPASGSGTCRSADGTWSLSYTGSWSESGVWGQAPSCPGGYQVTVTVANVSTGATASALQEWQPQGPASPYPMAVGTTAVEPYGAGVISQAPDACGLPATMATSANWVFVLDT